MVRRLELYTLHVQKGDNYRWKMTVLGQFPVFGLKLGRCSTCKVEIGTVTLRNHFVPVYYATTVIRNEICIFFTNFRLAIAITSTV